MERVGVVGGGVLGTWHAVAARRAGPGRLPPERDAEPRGGGGGNFGLIGGGGGGPGPERSRARGARAAGEELAAGPELYHRSEIAPGVVLVTGRGGRGMTCAAAIAEETFA